MPVLFDLKIVFVVCLALSVLNSSGLAQAMDSDLPPPPTRPERFTSKQQLKDYLV
jgi:hypothetical protein